MVMKMRLLVFCHCSYVKAFGCWRWHQHLQPEPGGSSSLGSSTVNRGDAKAPQTIMCLHKTFFKQLVNLENKHSGTKSLYILSTVSLNKFDFFYSDLLVYTVLPS